MPLLREHHDDLNALIGLTAEALGIGAIFVEKDFWVTEVLRAATTPIDLEARDGSRHRVLIIFKGGTSLSRVYRLIDRFSEDVDLLLGFPDVDASTGAKDRVLKGIQQAVTAHLALDSTQVATEPSTRGVKRNLRYVYDGIGYEAADIVSSGVLLEMGCRGGTYPANAHELRSMVAEHAIDVLGESSDAWNEFAPVHVHVLAPERTLLEKLALLHDCAARYPDKDAHERLIRGARHLYDVQRLLSSDQVTAALESMGSDGVAALCADIDNESERATFSHTPRPDGGYGSSPLVDPSASCWPALADGYAQAMALVYGYQPRFEECIETIRARATLL
jgi:hypothetical protein